MSNLRSVQLFRGFLSLLILLGFLSSWCLSHVAAQLPADRSALAHLEELERRQLFGSIIRHCERHFSDSQLPDGYRSQLAARWIRALTLQALNSEQQTSGSQWSDVRSTAQRLVEETRFFPQQALVRFQASLIGLGEARLASLLRGTSGEPSEMGARGLEAVRQSIEDLRVLNQELQNLASTAAERPDPREPFPEFTRSQFQSLARDVEYQMLAAFAIRIRFYEAQETASREYTYQEMTDLGERLQPKLHNESVLWWETQALILEAYRGLAEPSRWTIKWNNSPLVLAPNQVLGKMVAARLELMLDQREYLDCAVEAADFFALLQKREPSAMREVQGIADLKHATPWPEFDLVRARVFLVLAIEADRRASQADGTTTTATQMAAEAQILEFSRVVSQRHGGYWSGEMNRRLLGSVAATSDRQQISLLLVRQAMSDGQWEQARDLVQTGIQQARKSGNADLAMELATLVASAGSSLPPEAWMVEQIETAALAFPQHPQAERNHHYANILAFHLSAKSHEMAEAALSVWQRHVENWPNTETAHNARLQIASFYHSREKYEDALDALLGVSTDASVFSTATVQWTKTVSAMLQQATLSDSQRRQLAERWVPLVLPKLQEDGQWIGQWSLDTKRLSFVLIQLQLETSNPEVAWIGNLLQLCEQRLPDLDAELYSRWVVISVAAESFRSAGGTQALERLGRDKTLVNANDYLWLIATLGRRIPPLGLDGISASSTDATSQRHGMIRRAAQVQITASEYLTQLDRDRWAPYEAWLTQQQIAALLQLERIQEAIGIARPAAKAHPKSLPHQQWLGYSLAQSNHPSDSEAAEKHWRSIESLTKEASDPWFEAKYYLVDAQRRLGKTKDAEQRLKYWKLTKSEAWNQSKYRDQLERLLKSLGSN